MRMRTMRGLAALCMALVGVLGVSAAAVTTPPPPVVLWYAPFLSGGGYCSEAHSYAVAIAAALGEGEQQPEGVVSSPSRDEAKEAETEDATLPFELLLTQHGDALNPSFIRDIPPAMQSLLNEHWIEERDFRWRLRQREVALAICHSEPGAWVPARYHTSRCPPDAARYRVGRTMFETDRVPQGWAERMNGMDEIWVPTAFQEQIFVAGGVLPERVKVVPEVVDVHFFDPARVHDAYDLAGEAAFDMTADTTVFLSIFKWEERKAWRVLLSAYFQAFAPQDDVVLVLLTNGYHIASSSAGDFMNVIEEFTLETLGKMLNELPNLHVLPPQLPQEALPGLYKAANAFVLPSRGEGWGRPHVEAMAMARPVIATYWSGTTEYMTEDNSYPLRINGLVEIPDGAFRGHMWADPSVDHLQELFVRVKENPEEAVAKGKQARQDMVAKYSPEIIGDLVVGHITRILAHVAQQQAATESEAGHEEL